MGYACPVCDEHVPDAEHLADHLAFAAVTGDDAHESWLDEHAPGWESGGTEDLAPRVTEHASTVDFEVDTHPVEGHGHDHRSERRDGAGNAALDAEAQRILEEAAEMTREMQRGADGVEAPNERTATDGDREQESSEQESTAEGETE